MKLLAALGGEQSLLPHLVTHYASLGVKEFHFTSRNGTKIPSLPKGDFEIYLTTSYDGFHDVHKDCEAVQKIQQRVIAPDEWFFITDGDEFARFVFPITDTIQEANRRNCTWVIGRIIDRIARNGKLAEVLPNSNLSDLFPQRVAFTAAFGSPSVKAVLVKGQTTLTPGHHTCDGLALDVALEVDHYKWHSGLIRRLEERIQLYKVLGYEWWVQSDAFLHHYKHHGRIDLTKILVYI